MNPENPDQILGIDILPTSEDEDQSLEGPRETIEQLIVFLKDKNIAITPMRPPFIGVDDKERVNIGLLESIEESDLKHLLAEYLLKKRMHV